MNLTVFLAISGFLNGITSFVLGLFVLSTNKNRLLNRTYFCFNLSIALWSAGYIFWPLSSDRDSALLWFRILHYGAAFIPACYYHFVLALTERTRTNRISCVAGYLLALAFCSIISSTLFIRDMLPKFSLKFWAVPGIMYHFFLLYFFVYVLMSLKILWKEQATATGRKKDQYKYVLIATLIGYAGGATNYPLWYNIPIYPVGNILVTLYDAIIAYAIVRHQLLDIEVIVKRTLVFAGLAGSVVIVVSLVTFISQDLLAHFIQVPRYCSNVVAAIVIAATYGRLRDWLVNATEKYLFQKKYNYKDLLKRFTDEVMVIVDLKKLVETTVSTLSDTVKLNSCSLLLLNRDSRKYELISSKGANGLQFTLDEQEAFITFLRETHEPIVLSGELSKVRFPETMIQPAQHLKAQLCLPLNLHEDLIGVLCLGKKKSDEDFTKDDLDILLPLARTLAIAVSNAQLFDELAKTQAEAAQREKLAVIGTLSAGINHEICNPLGIVKTQSEAFLLDLKEGLLSNQPTEVIVQRAASILTGTLKQIDRATSITQKLSNFAKPIKEATAQPVSVDHEVDEVLALVGHDLKLERVDVLKEIPADLPSIVVDRRQLQEVLFNLIRNAGQAIKPPGRITVRAHADENHLVRIEIEDTGSGIPPDKVGKIYDPFFTTKEPGKGTGLGLFIVRQIVERNRGRIAVESVVGKGTTFLLDFPAAKPAPTAA